MRRIPEGSTARYVAWANRLTNEQLYQHQYRECTLLAPTWFLRRDWFHEVGGFLDPPPGSEYHLEAGKAPAVPEDLIFFYKVGVVAITSRCGGVVANLPVLCH